ncbi:MAG TPA: metal ABC transporter substrate-binding protein [Actinomycetales bacterium]|nr:metal ABC transporter substrate-binding protein [Actinomycetales bacterium]
MFQFAASARLRRAAVQVALPAALAALLGACTTGSTLTSGSSDGSTGDERLQIVAAFYPLEYLSERIGRGHVDVRNLTKPGVEAHDLELAPRDVARVAGADLIVYLKGFQPAVDDAIAAEAAGRALDVTSSAHLTSVSSEDAATHDHEADEHPDDDTHAPDDAAGHDDTHAPDDAAGHDHGGVDPHFWLDPTRLADVAGVVAARLAQLDPANAQDYRSNAAALQTDLHALDDDFRAGLEHCANRDMVTSHLAFGYLAERYDLHQVGITGLSPEGEPAPRDMARVVRFIQANHVETVYYEPLAGPVLAETVADETGARAVLLDPLEGLTANSPGESYIDVMRSNLAALRTGQGCS